MGFSSLFGCFDDAQGTQTPSTQGTLGPQWLGLVHSTQAPAVPASDPSSSQYGVVGYWSAQRSPATVQGMQTPAPAISQIGRPGSVHWVGEVQGVVPESEGGPPSLGGPPSVGEPESGTPGTQMESSQVHAPPRQPGTEAQSDATSHR
jgi:hypothetical protein